MTYCADGRRLPVLHKFPSDISSSNKLKSPSSQFRLSKLPSEISSSDKLDSPSSQLRLEKSKTERPKRSNILVEEASQIFDQKLSVHPKVRCFYAHDTFTFVCVYLDSSE